MFGEPRTHYVSRRTSAWAKDYRRNRERDGLPIDPDDFEQAAIQARYDAEDAWDALHDTRRHR